MILKFISIAIFFIITLFILTEGYAIIIYFKPDFKKILKRKQADRLRFLVTLILTLCFGTCIFIFGNNSSLKKAEPVSSNKNTVKSDFDNDDNVDSDNTSNEKASSPDSNSGKNDENATNAEDNFSIVMVGDVLIHTPVAGTCKQKDGKYDFDCLFEHTKDEIAGADLALVNQEVILGGEELGVSGYPAFNAPYSLGDSLVDTGFDVILHGTNHALDKGKAGVTNCLNYWKNNHPDIGVLGISDSQEKYDSVYIYEEKGYKIAILNYTFGTNGINPPSDMPYCVSYLKDDKIKADLNYAEKNADFTIVCPHWGTEYVLNETDEQKKWAKIFYENGADLCIGTHPHVIEPIEWYGDGNNKMLTYYSIGNFASWTSSSGDTIANRNIGGMAKINLTKTTDGNVKISEYGIEPLICQDENKTNGVTVYPISQYTKDLESKNEIRKQDSNFSIDYAKDLCNKVWANIDWESEELMEN